MVFCVLAAMLQQPSVSFRIQPVEDTYLDVQLPDANFGHDPYLIGGPKSIILVRFPGLDWLPDGQVPDSAVLTLHVQDHGDVKLTSVRKMLVPWSEGSGLRLPLPQTNSEAALSGTATWLSSKHGVAKWQSPGASGERDSVPVSGVTVVTEGENVRLVGLGPVLAEMAKRPSKNYGLRLEFASPVTFDSSDSPSFEPTLALSTKTVPTGSSRLVVTTLEPGEGNKWVANVKNTGDAPATGWNATWTYRGSTVGEGNSQQAIAPGDTVQIEAQIPVKADGSEPRKNYLTLSVESGGQGGAIAERSVPVNGLPVRFEFSKMSRDTLDKLRGEEPLDSYLQRVVACTNEAVLAQSKASFAPDGCKERLRLTTSTEPAQSVAVDSVPSDPDAAFRELVKDTTRAISPFGGKWATPPDTSPWPDLSLGWVADTRDDSMWPTTLTLPQFPWGMPKAMQPALMQRGLLGRAEIAGLNQRAGLPFDQRAAVLPTVAKVLILSIMDGGGAPISSADVQIFRTKNGALSTEPVYNTKTSANGFLVLGAVDGKGPFSDLSPDGSNAWYMVRVTKEFVTDDVWLPATTVISETARGNAAPNLELRMMMASAPIKTDDDLAAGKIVSDSLGRYPSELVAVVDNDPKTTVDIEPTPKPYTLDIDLGRDRLIGAVEIETTGGIWDKFELSTSRTGQKDEFSPWFTEGAGSVRMAERGQAVDGHKVLTYTATAARGRVLRLTVISGSKVDVAAIRVRTLQQGG